MSTNKYCPHTYETSLPPCISLGVVKYNYLKDLLNNNKGSNQELMIAHSIECIEFKNKAIDIKNENCINCMYCVFGCPGNNIEIDNKFKLSALCSDFKSDYENRLKQETLDKLFNGSFIKLPKIRLAQFKVKYKSFSDFTSVDETKNISVWGANSLKFLSKSSNPKLGLEIGMNIKSRDRGGRLDICLLNNGLLLVAEAKVSFSKMMNENRYLSQMIAYEEEILSTLEKNNNNIKHYKFLLIGGNESDLLPPSHPECTSNVGDQSSIFYNNCLDNNIFFISANAILSLGIKKVFFGDNYSIENLTSNIFSSENIGLLSCGVIKKNMEIKPLKTNE
jgi:NAD-dependent dihydropyrimidine dehydrogenase PreA subunit